MEPITAMDLQFSNQSEQLRPSVQTAFPIHYPTLTESRPHNFHSFLDLSPLCTHLYGASNLPIGPRLQSYQHLHSWYQLLLQTQPCSSPFPEFDSSASSASQILQLLPLPDHCRPILFAAINALNAVLLYLQAQGPATFIGELTYYHHVILEKHLPLCQVLYQLDEQRRALLLSSSEVEVFPPDYVFDNLVSQIWADSPDTNNLFSPGSSNFRSSSPLRVYRPLVFQPPSS